MSTRPRLSRNIAFWLLIVGSLATTATGVYLLIDRLGGMDARLTDGTATTNDVYVGQIWAVLGAILIGAGLIGFALALTIGALRALAPTAATDHVDPPSETGDTEQIGGDVDADASADDYGYAADLGYEPNEEPQNGSSGSTAIATNSSVR